MNIASRTDIGLVRSSNQDALLICAEKHALYGVADGMGGHNAGDVASRMTVQLLPKMLKGSRPQEKKLRSAVEMVNKLIFNEQRKDASLNGMGTTLTVLWEDEDRLLLAHVGDSRAYCLHEGKLQQVSEDHSVVGELVRNGVLTEEQARVHPFRNVITRAVGTERDIEVDVTVLEKVPGDLYLLCSDGLYEYVTNEQMQDILLEMPLEQAADELLRLALKGGGGDNITVLIAEVTA